jgi:hypothetical protein
MTMRHVGAMRSTSGNAVKRTAPMSTPRRLPTPPRNTITSRLTVSAMVSSPGHSTCT